ncbi:hypothetical protein [Pseudobacteriovorax antillogorgiicola]|uniref:Sigma-70, region 4 n=1 Tax=Pseudobacteriovorax antillogorgiicola TaxID=1513793 RepID=A0A1Y6CN33_9BACT|nr:hypothetical protein [Pseudobacteriovorax antillogorgiicola]TCS44777.1 hypothetical protein EDD56_1316 [Pseudobacteriovorax antillogorgiicola]SMF77533.1 hypothetical protein SAMN06296036_13158 [Pseudobacteriovorax antillogorgiicola]
MSTVPSSHSDLQPCPFAESLRSPFQVDRDILKAVVSAQSNLMRRTIAERFFLKQESIAFIAEGLKLSPQQVTDHLRRFQLLLSKALLRFLQDNRA